MNFLDLTNEERHKFIRLQNTNYASSPEEVTCPYCDTKQRLDFEDVSYNDDDSVTVTCWYDVCEREFQVRTSVSYDFITEVDDDEIYKQIQQERKANG